MVNFLGYTLLDISHEVQETQETLQYELIQTDLWVKAHIRF